MEHLQSQPESKVMLVVSEWPIYARRLYQHETDSDGVCHFSNYFRIAEEALFFGLLRIGCAVPINTRLVVREATGVYLKSLRAHSEFSVKLSAVQISRATFGLIFDILVGDTNTTVLKLKFACVNTETDQPSPLPLDLKCSLIDIQHNLSQGRSNGKQN